MQRLTRMDMWDMDECQSPRMGSVILGVDGGASNTVCVCIPAAMPFADPLPVLSRTIAGCSNQNSVGDGKHPFPLVMVGKVLEANNSWDIGKQVIDCVTKNYPGAYPIHPKVETAMGAALLAWNAIARELDGDIQTVQ